MGIVIWQEQLFQNRSESYKWGDEKGSLVQIYEPREQIIFFWSKNSGFDPT